MVSGCQNLVWLCWAHSFRVSPRLQSMGDVIMSRFNRGSICFHMVKNSRNIDLVIGGHSHTYLKQARMVEYLDGRSVPVTQCGGQGIVVGTWEITRVRP